MPINYYVTIDGVNVGPGGDNILSDMECEVAGPNQVGYATLVLTYHETAPYVWLQGMKVQVYKTGGAAGFGYLGGIITNKKEELVTKKLPTYLTVTLEVQDVNVAFDTVVKRVSPYIGISAGTLKTQVAALAAQMQNSGTGVQWALDASTYVPNLIPASTLPAFGTNGRSWRDCMDEIMANAFAADNTLRLGYHAALMSDGAGGVTPCILVYNKADVTTSEFTIATDAGVGEYRPYSIENITNGALLTQKQQARYGEPVGQTITYENTASRDTYPNVFVNDGGPDDTGFFWDLPYNDTESATLAEATAILQQKVKSKEYPIQTITIEQDNIDIMPGKIAALRIPSLSLDSNFVAVAVKVRFLKTGDGITYSRSTITFGRRKRALGDTGEDEEAVPPDGILTPHPLDPPASFALTSNAYDYSLLSAVLVFAIGPSPNPRVVGYEIIGTIAGIPYRQDVGASLAPAILVRPGVAYSVRARGYDTARNYTTTMPAPADPALTGTTATASYLDDPSLAVISSGRDKSGYYILVEVNHASISSTYGGSVRLHPTPNGPDRFINIAASLAEPLALPCEVYIPNAHPNVAYELSAQVVTQYGQESEFTTPAVSHTVAYIPGPDPPQGGWDDVPVDDEAGRGLEFLTGTVAEIAWDTSVLGEGKTSLKITNGIGGDTSVTREKWSVRPNEKLAVGVARKRSGGLGTAPPTSLKWNWYKADDTASAVTPTETIFSAQATTTFVYDDGVVTAPSDAAYGRWVLQQHDSGGGGTAYSSYFTLPTVERQATSKRIADGAVDTQHIAPGAVTQDKTYFQPTAGDPIYGYDEDGEPITAQYWSEGGERWVMQAVGSTAHPTTGWQMRDSDGIASMDMAGGTTTWTGVVRTTHDLAPTSILATNATEGFWHIPKCDGTPTGTPADYAGIPIVWDYANELLYAYSKGNWIVV